MTFTPFKKTSISELDATDLSVLIDIPEGWFIEYKREPCNSKNYAKEASAFANSKGGWMFIGLEEDSKTRKPLGGPGLQTSEATKFLNAARDAIIQNLSPSPYIEFTTVPGPIPALSIPNDKCILVIHIPESQNTPHIHCSGKIYRRQADSSDPVEINDRAELDTLYKQAENLHNLIDEKLDLGFDNAWRDYSESSWLHYALIPDPALSFKPHDIDLNKFRELLAHHINMSNQVGISLPDVYPSSLGFVARNCREQIIPDGVALTLEYTYDGAFYLSIPLSSGPVLDLCNNSVYINNQTVKRFASLLKNNRLGGARVIDCSYIVICLCGMHTIISRLLNEAGECSNYFTRMRMINVFRSVPFIASDLYIDSYLNRSIPIIHRKEIAIPWRKNRWLEINNISDLKSFLFYIGFMLTSLGIGGDGDIGNIVGQTVEALIKKNDEKTK